MALLGLPLYVFLPAVYAADLGLGLAAVGAVLLALRALDVASDPAMRQKRIQRLDYHFTVELIVESGRCCGALVLNEHSGRQFILPARAVVLSTGGAGQIYARTTNPVNATGDGMAMLRAGAVLQDMEFVQFHPTALYLPSSPPFLLSEAMRGEGARLRNSKGELFMQRYHPMGALAPRDIVSRAI